MTAALFALALTPLACTANLGEDEHGDEHGHETEVISRVELSFAPDDGGDAVVVAFSDPDGDGGMSGTTEPLTLTQGTSYTLTISLLNDLEDPPEDIGEEIADEAEEHMFFLAEADGLLTHDYADLESDYGDNLVGDDLPVGVVHTVTANVGGTGTLRVLLRHLPELNGEPQKSADLPELFAAGDALPGDVDVDVSFDLTVQ